MYIVYKLIPRLNIARDKLYPVCRIRRASHFPSDCSIPRRCSNFTPGFELNICHVNLKTDCRDLSSGSLFSSYQNLPDLQGQGWHRTRAKYRQFGRTPVLGSIITHISESRQQKFSFKQMSHNSFPTKVSLAII
jgi:hypothetical protein